MRDRLKRLEEEAFSELRAARGESQVQAVRTKYIGRKGLLTHWLKEVGKLPASERPALGQMVNELKAGLEQATERALKRSGNGKKFNGCWARKLTIAYRGGNPPGAENTSSPR